MGRNIRDKLCKKNSKCQLERKNNSFPTYMYICKPFFCKINVSQQVK